MFLTLRMRKRISRAEAMPYGLQVLRKV
jgi:hypothetical protein